MSARPRRTLGTFFFIFLFSSFAAAQAQIDRIEVNQAIGIQKNNALKFVAGKDTVIRAFLTSAVIVDPAQTKADITRDGQAIATLQPNSYDGATSVVDFQCPSRAACGNWAAGNYTFAVMVNGVTKDTMGTNYSFVERGTLRILAVPVKANYGGVVVPVTNDSWKKMWQFTRSTYPVAADKFQWVEHEGLDLSDSMYDLETDQGRFNVWETLAKLMPLNCVENPSGPGCFNQIFGFIMARPNGFPNGNLQGYTYGKPANIGVITDQDAPATVAHEIGHTYGLGDTYNGGSFNCPVNPAPADFQGKDWVERTKTVSCTAQGKNALTGVGGTLVPAEHSPYEVGGRGSLPNMAEFMGSDGNQSQFWITQDAYDRLFDQLAPSQALTALATTPLRLINFSGLIRQNANTSADVTVEPWYSFTDSIVIPNTIGNYMIAAVNAAGTLLATHALQLEFDVVGSKGQPPKHVDPAPFEGEMPFPDGTTKFQIIRGTQVVREIAVSPRAPVVSAVASTLTGTISGSKLITWTASDPDGDRLSFAVAFNPDVTNPNSDWDLLARDLTVPQFNQNFDELPGGPHAKIAVIATDGVNTTEVESAEFVVAAKPPAVFIETLPSGGVTGAGREVALEGVAEDLQDGEIPDSNLQWSSNISGALGIGSKLVVRGLPQGTHIISLKATNSLGLTATDTVTLTVLPPNTFKPYEIPARGGVSRTTSGASSAVNMGYVRIRPTADDPAPSGIAIFGFRQGGILVSEAAVNASPLIRSGRIYAEVNGRVNTGVAIANPNSQPATISFYFTSSTGTNFGNNTFSIPANGQIAAFVDQSPFNSGSNLVGTMTFSASVPVAAVALRGLNNERSEFLITTLPVVDLTPVPGNSIVLSHFADGGGWTTQVVLVNPTDNVLTGTFQFFSQGTSSAAGQPVTVTVDGQTGTTFTYNIPARSSRRVATSGLAGTSVAGSIRLSTTGGTALPSGLSVFSFKKDGVTVSEAGVSSSVPSNAQRMYAEFSATAQSGVAVANMSSNAVAVNFELTALDGTGFRTGSAAVPGNGQIAVLLNQILGFENLSDFQGILRITTSSTAGLSVVGLRGRTNERGDYLITTTAPVNENASQSTAELFFPHFADGGGYTTQFILFGGSPTQLPDGALLFVNQSGQNTTLNLK